LDSSARRNRPQQEKQMQPSGIRLKYRLRAILLIGSLISLGGIAQESANTAQSRPEATKAALSCLLASNCVNSLDDMSSLPALRFNGSADEGKAILLATLAAFPEASVVKNEALQVEAVFTTPIGFRDQVLFHIDAANKRIDFRSGSNIGLYDFGKNRSRMKEFSARFEKESGR